MRFKNVFCVSAAFSLFACSTAFASPLIWLSDANGNLGTVDVGLESAAIIGNMGVKMTDIAFSPTGSLYGISLTGSLYSINTGTAAATLIGAFSDPSFGVLNSLVFDSNGNLYAADSSLYKINVNTGAALLVGPGGGYESSGDLAFINGSLYLSAKGSVSSDQLFKIDTTNGSGSLVGNIGAYSMFGLATADNLTLYGTAGTFIYKVDAGTGAGTPLFDYYTPGGLGVAWGSAFMTESNPVPEPATMLLLGAGIAGIAGARMRKKK